jgi:integrase
MDKRRTHPGIRRHRGKWQARFRAPSGVLRSKAFDRKSDAIQFLADMRSDIRRGSWIDPGKSKQPYGFWAEEWLRGLHSMGPARRKNAEGMMNNHILPVFGRMPIGLIGPVEVRRWVNDLVTQSQVTNGGRPLGPWTVRATYGLFARSMRAAVAAKVIGEAPVGREIVDLPEVRRKRERCLKEDEVELLASNFAPGHRALVYAAAWTGCRWSELAGLTKANLDLGNAELHVRSVAERVSSGRVELKEIAKTQSSWRTVGIPTQLVDILRFQLGKHPASDLVFPSREGGPLLYGNFRRRHWNPAVVGASLQPLTFHDLRHTHVSWLIDAGWTEFRIVRRMGWKDGRMLHTVYGHLFTERDPDLMAGLERRWDAAGD